MPAIIATNVALPNLNVVVLAAGLSSRLGQPKALARVHGCSLLQRTLKIAAALRGVRITVIVPPVSSRYRKEATHLSVTWVPNPRRKSGLSSSVICGLRRSQYASAALLLPVDLVRLKLSELKKLVSHWRAAPGRVYATRIANRAGEQAGAPLILPVRFFPRAASINGDVGLRALVAGVAPCERTLVDLPSAHVDVDTVLDLALARQRWH